MHFQLKFLILLHKLIQPNCNWLCSRHIYVIWYLKRLSIKSDSFNFDFCFKFDYLTKFDELNKRSLEGKKINQIQEDCLKEIYDLKL